MALSVINRPVGATMELNTIAKIHKYGFMRGTTHLGVIWIISLGNVPVFSTIDDQEVIYPCLFAFNFLSNVLVLLFNVL
jgi:hypothetical protein